MKIINKHSFPYLLLSLYSFFLFFSTTGNWGYISDHGEFLLNVDLILKGFPIYSKFHYCYGPLMPYIFAAIFYIVGNYMINAYIIWFVFYTATIILLFHILKERHGIPLSLFFSIIFARLFLYDNSSHVAIIHSFNHIGCVFAILLYLYYLQIDSQNNRIRFYPFFFIIITILIKHNIGLALLSAHNFIILFLISKNYRKNGKK